MRIINRPSSQLSVRGVICDLDGTLADTLEDIGDSMNRALEKRGFPLHTYEEYKIFIGRGLRNLTVQSLPENFRDQESADSAFDDMFRHYSENCLVKTRLYEGIPELLDEFAARNILISVLSNKTDNLTQLVVSSLMGNWKMAKVTGASDTVPVKPDPAGAELVIEAMNLPRENIMYIGDTGTDMITASAAGVFPVGVTWGFRSADELVEKGARVLVDHPSELVELLDGKL